MPQFYKANKSIKGCGCSLSLNSKDASVFIGLIKQTSYDEARHLGSFASGDKISIKCNLTEIGSLLDALNRNIVYSTVHKSNDGMTSIKFEPYVVGEGEEKQQRGYGLYIYRKTGDKELKFLMPFNFAEAEILKEYFSFCIRQIFHTEYSEAKKQYKSKQEEKAASIGDTKKILPNPEAEDEEI